METTNHQITSLPREEEKQYASVPQHEGDAPHDSGISSSNATLLGRIENWFQLKQRGSTWSTEFRAGCVTFVTMAYILAVNASIISETGGPCLLPSESSSEGDPTEPFSTTSSFEDEMRAFHECREIVRLDLITATATGALIGSFMMGFSANMPIGLAPGMGINAYFTYSVVGPWYDRKAVNYNTALCAVFIEGWIFILLAVTGLRIYIAKLIPVNLKSAITAGIGLFLALIGLQKDEGIALVVSDGATNLTLGGCGHTIQSGLQCMIEIEDSGLDCSCAEGTTLAGATTWLGILGLIIIMVCMANRVKGGIIFGILFVSFVSWFRGTKVTYFPDTDQGNRRFEYFSQVVAFHPIQKTGGILFDNLDFSSAEVWVALITMLYVDILDTTGTLYSMAQFSGLMDKKTGNFPRSTMAFCSDAVGTVVGACLGTTDVTAYIESGAGILEGGMTGITACMVGFLFFLSLFFTPIFASIPPYATGPALVVIGALMMDTVSDINWRDYRQAFPAFLTIVIMPFTYSIAYGIIAGLALHAILYATDRMFDFCCSRIKSCNKCNMKRYQVENEQLTAAENSHDGDAEEMDELRYKNQADTSTEK